MDCASNRLRILASDKQLEKHREFISEVEMCYRIASIEETGVPVLLLGGDGSINHLLKCLAHEKDLEVLYFPTGTANDFARSLKIMPTPPHVEKIEAILRQNQTINVPIMSCNGQHFINVASLGAPARITNSGDDLLKQVMGKVSYYMGGLEEIVNGESYQVHYQVDDAPVKELETRGFLIAQGLYAGGGAKVSSSYAPNFGRCFSFFTIKGKDLTSSVTSLIELQKDLPKLGNNVINHFCSKLTITCSSPIPAKLDGEEFSASEFVFKKEDRLVKFYMH